MSASARARRSGGFTLLEVVLSVAIIFTVLALATALAVRARHASQTARARGDLVRLQDALHEHMLEYGSYPDTTDLATSAVTNWLPGTFRFEDPWGHVYEYVRHSSYSYRLWSDGADLLSVSDDLEAGRQ